MEIIKELKGGSLSRTVVVEEEGATVVRKLISKTENREYGLIRWQSQIRKLQQISCNIPESCIKIIKMGEVDNYYFYDMPYYDEYEDCYKALMGGVCSPTLLTERIVEVLRKFAKLRYNKVKGSLSVYVTEEIYAPLRMALRDDLYINKEIERDEKEFLRDKIRRVMPKVSKLIEETREVTCKETLTHGNLTLENILWDKVGKRVILIDPYAETHCESLTGDISQLLQSSQSGYEYLSNMLCEKKFKIIDNDGYKLPEKLNEFTNILTKALQREAWYEKELLMVFRASQFTRMFPFKVSKQPRLAVLFMLHGIQLLDEVKC